jgi:hypothetical protein
MRGGGHLFAVLLAVIPWASALGQPVVRPSGEIRVERRGGLPELAGTLRSMDERGVLLDSRRLGERLVPWDRIRRLHGASDPRMDGWLEDGTRVWRARIRISRGDPLSAEPLLEPLFDRFVGRTDELALVVAEGLLRCRIARGANDLAVVPMLETIRLRDAGVSSTAYASLPPVFEDAWSLVPAVPPAWHAGADRAGLATRLHETLRRLEQTLAAEGAAPTPRTAAARRAASIASWYLAAVRAEEGSPLRPPTITAGDDPGLRLLAEVLTGRPPEAADAAGGDPEAPPDPRAILEAATPGPTEPAWTGDWRDYFEGRRGLLADESAEREAGMLRLLRPAALRPSERPYLAGIGLARAADALERMGRPEEAAILRADLAARFPGHPERPAGPPGDPEVSLP